MADGWSGRCGLGREVSQLAVRRKPHVLVVDDVQSNRELLFARLKALDYVVREAKDGVEALEAIEADEPDLILLDVNMPRMDGIAVCQKLKAHPTRRLVPIIMLTASHDPAQRLRGLAAGADDYLSKPFDANELLIRTRVLLKDRALNLKLNATEDVLFALASAVEARDRYTIFHAERVGQYAGEVGKLLGFDGEDGELLHHGGVLHDLGKIVIPDAILLKPGPLSAEEYAEMQRHSAEGERICLSLRSVSFYLPIIRHHHERFDGMGYPDHLANSDIPIGARIVAVADAWDAMTSDRPYRARLDLDEALGEVRSGSGSQWDAEVVGALLHLVDSGALARVAESVVLPVA
jgi:putative two-component system response regulator